MHGKIGLDREIIDSADTLAKYALFLTKAQDSANVLKQETMLRIFKNSDKYKSQVSFNTWAKRVMKSIFLSNTRKYTSYKNKFVEYFNYTNDESSEPVDSPFLIIKICPKKTKNISLH